MSDTKQTVSPGKYVELGYDLYTIDGDGRETIVHQTDMADPEKIVFGVTPGVIEPLQKALEGLSEGGEFDVKVKADEAFGEYNPEHVVTLEREIFVVDGEFDSDMIKVGNHVPMMTADGFRMMGLVKEVTPEHVVMDFNHPLAGKDIRFKGKVTVVRDATEEELHVSEGCGCGDNGCGCGDSCGCGDNPEGGCGCSCGGCE